MKTINEIKDLIELRIAQLNDEGKKGVKKLDDDIVLYKKCLMYLESSPSEEFVTKQHETLVNKINKINQLCEERQLATSKDKTEYKNALGMKELKEQLKYIEFIIN
jgi:hypothetical protein